MTESELSKKSAGRKIIAIVFFAALFVFAANALGVGFWLYHSFDSPGPLAAEKTVIVEKGTSLRGIARQLRQEEIIHHDFPFIVFARLFDSHAAMQAGEYQFLPGETMQDVLQKIAEGKVLLRKITFAEGLTSKEIAALIFSGEGLAGEISKIPEEGSLLPETYSYPYGEDRAALIVRMQQAMRHNLEKLWQSRQQNLPYENMNQALVMASIVEKETGIAAERKRVAAVFVNRLRRGMPLQADPTVAYAKLLWGGGDAPLTYADLARDHPYNTYVRGGLPPGPICNPGLAAIEAALNPETTDELYFVADGKGGHVFAKTLAEHNRNVAAWRKLNSR